MFRTCKQPVHVLFSLILFACGEAPQSSAFQPNESLQNEPKNDSGTSSYGCHPDYGKAGLLKSSGSAYSYYRYRDGWCSVGTGISAGCYAGKYIVWQGLVGSSCVAPVAGSCTDPASMHYVTCDEWVSCLYNCEGKCIPIPCP